MAGRVDIPLILVAISYLATLTLYYLNSVLWVIPTLIAYLGMASYAVYWAFNLRRALSVGLYRNQALGIGLVAAIQVPDLIAHGVFAPLGIYLAFFVVEAIVSWVVFYFVDASVLAGRRSDPLLRDTLHWRSLRIFLWPAIIAAQAAVVAVAAYFQVGTGGLSSSTAFTINQVRSLLDWVVDLAVVVAIPVTALRSKDPRLHAHFAWFGAFFAFVLVLVPVGNNLVALPAFVGQALVGFALLGEVYSLYRSTRSLAPLNRLSLEARQAWRT